MPHPSPSNVLYEAAASNTLALFVVLQSGAGCHPLDASQVHVDMDHAAYGGQQGPWTSSIGKGHDDLKDPLRGGGSARLPRQKLTPATATSASVRVRPRSENLSAGRRRGTADDGDDSDGSSVHVWSDTEEDPDTRRRIQELVGPWDWIDEVRMVFLEMFCEVLGHWDVDSGTWDKVSQACATSVCGG